MSVSLAYLEALRNYLEEQYQVDPPLHGTLGVLKIGSFQDSPENAPAVVNLLTYNPFDESYADPHWSFIKNQDSGGVGQDRSYQAFGGLREIGGGGLYDMWFWAKCDYYMTRTGATQAQAWENNDALVNWLVRQIGLAQPHTLYLGEVNGAILVETVVVSAVTRERGGAPASYIWTTLIKIQGLVYRDT